MRHSRNIPIPLITTYASEMSALNLKIFARFFILVWDRSQKVHSKKEVPYYQIVD